MKKFLSLTFMLIVTLSYADQYKPGDTLNMLSDNGSFLRDSNSFKSKKICLIKYGEQVTVLKNKEISKYDIGYGIPGYWIYVQYLDKKGYIFDGFVSRMPAPVLNNENNLDLPVIFNHLDLYLSKEYGVYSFITNSDIPTNDNKFETTKIYSNKAEFIYESYYGGEIFGYVVKFPLMRIGDIFMIYQLFKVPFIKDIDPYLLTNDHVEFTTNDVKYKMNVEKSDKFIKSIIVEMKNMEGSRFDFSIENKTNFIKASFSGGGQ